MATSPSALTLGELGRGENLFKNQLSTIKGSSILEAHIKFLLIFPGHYCTPLAQTGEVILKDPFFHVMGYHKNGGALILMHTH